MELSSEARQRLAGQWGSYDFHLIRDSHFVTSSELIERFIQHVTAQWRYLLNPVDEEMLSNMAEVRRLLSVWAEDKLATIIGVEAVPVVHADILFKAICFSDETLNFGSVGTNWKPKSEIARELARYRPWSIRHALSKYGNQAELYRHMRSIIERSKSPTEITFFKSWWELSESVDRPMLFPQVWGHTSGKLWSIKNGQPFPTRFDFGFVNSERHSKILIECDSVSYHTNPSDYQRDRDRQNLAERNDWSVRRFTYVDVMQDIEGCFSNISPDIDPYFD